MGGLFGGGGAPKAPSAQELANKSKTTINTLAPTVGAANIGGAQQGTNAFVNYLNSGGRTMTLDPARQAELDKQVADAKKAQPKSQAALDKATAAKSKTEGQLAAAQAKAKADADKKVAAASKEAEASQAKLAAARANPKTSAKTLKSLEAATAKASSGLTSAQSFAAAPTSKAVKKQQGAVTKATSAYTAANNNFTQLGQSITTANTAMQTEGVSLVDSFQQADPQAYAALDSAGAYANKLGQVTSQGQAFIDANSAGYQSKDIAAERIAGSQAGNVADVQAQQMQASQAGGYERVTGSQAQASQMGNVADVQAQQMQAAQAGGYERVASRDVSGAQITDTPQIGAINAARVRNISAQQVGQGQLGQSLYQTAQDRLALNGRLSSEASRDAVQQARAGYAARGMATGNSALAGELLNRDRYSQQRFQQDGAFASAVQNSDIGRQQQNSALSLDAARSNQAKATQLSLANQAAGMDAARANQAATLGVNQANAGYLQQANLANQDAALRASGLNQAAGMQTEQYNAGLRQSASAQNQDAALRAALSNQQTAFNTGQYNASNQQATSLANAQFGQQANLANQAAGMQTEQYNAGLRQSASVQNQDAALRAALSNQQTALSLGTTNAQLAQQAALANQQTGLQASTINESNRLASAQQNINQLGAASNYMEAKNAAGMNAQLGMMGQYSAMNPLIRNLGLGNMYNVNGLGSQVAGASIDMVGGIAGANMNAQAATDAGNKKLAGDTATAAASVGVAAACCWVARAAFGTSTSRWMLYRRAMLRSASDRTIRRYCQYGPAIATRITTPVRRFITRCLLRSLELAWK